MPSLEVAKSAIPYVSEAHFDGDKYAEYLAGRGVEEEQFSRLKLSVTDKLSFTAQADFRPAKLNDPESQHSIRFSAVRMPASISRQGKILRHETEHFIYQTRHPHHVRNRGIIVTSSSSALAISGGVLGYKAGLNASESLALLERLPIAISTGLGTAALTGAVTFIDFIAMGNVFGPSEIQAYLAERRKRKMLPDGVLQLEFKKRTI